MCIMYILQLVENTENNATRYTRFRNDLQNLTLFYIFVGIYISTSHESRKEKKKQEKYSQSEH